MSVEHSTEIPAVSFVCRLCGSAEFTLWKKGNVEGPLSSEDFLITSADYGVTADVYRCNHCGFAQCPDLAEVLGYYEQLEDTRYEEGRRERAIQARRILKRIQQFRASGKLLDVGAGSGMLVEQAREMGFEAEGIEPSGWLCEKAREHGLTVHQGVLPHSQAQGPYDVVVVMDVIEHVPDPLGLLAEVRKVAAVGGVVVVVTPDVRSIAARVLGRKWWHYRVAHVGYFDRKTLESAGSRVGLKLLRTYRPGWYFPLDYIVERVERYLPRFLRLRPPRFFRRIVLPVNFGDSLLQVFEVRSPDANGDQELR